MTTLSALAIGSLTLTPEFAEATTEYTAATTNATDTITATAATDGATVVIASDDATIAEGGIATWAVGENEVTITVTKGTEETVYTVTVTKYDPTLSALTVGALTLTPTFTAGTTSYTASTSNATDQITATAVDEDATVVIASETATIGDDGTATWTSGENAVTVTVTSGTATKTYTVTVTYTPASDPEEVPEG